MKKYILCALAATALAATAAEPLAVVKVASHTDTIAGNVLCVDMSSLTIRKPVQHEFTLMPGTDEITVEALEADSIPQWVVLFYPKTQEMVDLGYRLPGETLTLDATSGSNVIGGSEIAEHINAAAQYIEPYIQMLEASAPESRDPALQSMFRAAESYVRSHATTPAAVWMLRYMHTDTTPAMLELLDNDAINGSFVAPRVQAYRDYIKAAEEQKRAAERVAVGKPAPDFTLPDAEGNPVSLSSLKGKWVMLDFWGTWCGWCIKGIPQMKEQYALLKERNVEFVSVACNDPKDKWLAGLAKYEMPWIQLWQDPSVPRADQVTAAYAITGFPTKLIIDPEGNIANVTVGENPDFYQSFDNIQ